MQSLKPMQQEVCAVLLRSFVFSFRINNCTVCLLSLDSLLQVSRIPSFHGWLLVHPVTTPRLVYSLIVNYLDHFQALTIVNKAPLNIHRCVFVGKCFYFSWLNTFNGFYGHRASIYSTWPEIVWHENMLHYFSQRSFTILHSQEPCKEFPVPANSCFH